MLLFKEKNVYFYLQEMISFFNQKPSSQKKFGDFRNHLFFSPESLVLGNSSYSTNLFGSC
jgi:hypothetical protein